MSEVYKNRRVLVVDDNPDIRADFQKILAGIAAPEELNALEGSLFGGEAGGAPPASAGFDVASASQGQEGAAMVRQGVQQAKPYALAFVDMRMPPGWDGLRTAQEILAIDKEINVVLCTAYSDHSWERIKEATSAGDRLLVLKKPFDAVEVLQMCESLVTKWALQRRAAGEMSRLERMVDLRTAELREARQKDRLRLDELERIVERRTVELKRHAMHDGLTGLPNRSLFNDRLVQAIQRSRGEPAYRFAVMFLDIDRFKVINDSLGHEIGDLLLIAIADRLRSVLRQNDPVAGPNDPEDLSAARLGGDEFTVLLGGIKSDGDCHRVATRILEALSAPYDLRGRRVHCSASIGITVSSIGYMRAEDMLRDADNAMYRAKTAGKGRYVIFDRKMHSEAMQRLVFEEDLRHGLEAGQIKVYYQPIVDLRSGCLSGFEALARWQHPERGLVSPGQFIELAEETGLIIPLGTLVLREAARQMAEWNRIHPSSRQFSMGVNVSRKQLAAGITDTLRQSLLDSRLDPTRLYLEITENSLIGDAEAALRILGEIKNEGVGIYLDDFGIGYSSLSFLTSFPFDGLKVDQSFLTTQAMRRRRIAVVHSIITLAQNLDMGLVAEGVEAFDQVALLQSLNCERAQGFLFSRPIPAHAAESLLADNRRLAA